MGGFSLPLTHLHCSVAQLSKHFHTAPSACSHRELSNPGPIWSGSAGTPRSLWQRATSWLCLRIRFYAEAAFPAEQILLQQRGDSESPTIVSEVTFSHFYGFKSQLQSRSLIHKMQPGIIPDLPQGKHGDAGTAGPPAPCPSRCCSNCSSGTFPASAAPGACCKLDFFPLDGNGGKALGNCRKPSM